MINILKFMCLSCFVGVGSSKKKKVSYSLSFMGHWWWFIQLLAPQGSRSSLQLGSSLVIVIHNSTLPHVLFLPYCSFRQGIVLS